MPDNLYDLINYGELPNCNLVGNLQYLIVDGNSYLKGTLLVDGNVLFDNNYVYFSGPEFRAEGNTQIGGTLFAEGLCQFENNVLFTSNSTSPIIQFDNTTNVLIDGYFVEFQTPLSNIFIYGGSNGQVLTTDGTGNLSWTSGGGGGNASFIANGTSNVSIPSANGNVLISAAGNANVVIITGSEFRVNNKTANLGNVGNVRIGGGSNGDFLRTYGNGTVYFDTLTYTGLTYAVANPPGNTVTLPVYANSTSTRNIPLKYIGNTIADLWPYGNGSAVANASPGYVANSTAAFTPANAAVLNIPTTTASYDGWFKLIDSNTDSSLWGAGTTYVELTFHFDCYANASAEIQLVPFIHTTGSTDNQLQTQNQMIYDVKVFPKQTAIDITLHLGLGNTIDKLGMYIRNITANTEVTVTNGLIDIAQVR